MRRSKIVCTIGPASESEKVIRGLIQSGMDVARLNFSHGNYAFHERIIRTIRRTAQRLDKPVALLQDLPGPKIRVGPIEGNQVRLQTGRPFVLTTRKIVGNNQIVDKRDLAFGIEQGVDLVALSFVRDSKDIMQARREMKKKGAEVPIIAKIEKREALDHIDSILEAVDGIMVAITAGVPHHQAGTTNLITVKAID